MSRVSVSLSGAGKLNQQLSTIAQGAVSEVDKATVAAGIELRANIVRGIQSGPASGRVYRKSNPNRVHRASAPGEFPATDTGRLANNIFFEKLKPGVVSVGSTLIYALYLEYKPPSKGGRPFFRPEVEKLRTKFRDRIQAAVVRAEKNAT